MWALVIFMYLVWPLLSCTKIFRHGIIDSGTCFLCSKVVACVSATSADPSNECSRCTEACAVAFSVSAFARRCGSKVSSWPLQAMHTEVSRVARQQVVLSLRQWCCCSLACCTSPDGRQKWPMHAPRCFVPGNTKCSERALEAEGLAQSRRHHRRSRV